MSFYTSLSGLKAAQTALSVTANNVANVGTTAFKRSDSQFGDIISSSPLQSAAIPGQGTRLRSIDQQFTQGGFTTSERSLDLAISGQGFFVTRTGVTNGAITYTRNGSFKVDADRFVVDEGGNYVQVLPTDANGTVTAAGIEATRNLQVPLTSGLSRATSTMDLSINLPSSADIPSQRSVYTSSNPYAFDRFDLNSFNQQAATTVYDVNGNAIPATVYYTRKTVPTTADPTSTWEARLFVGDTEVSSDGNAATIPAAPMTLTFDSNGNLTSPTSATQYATVQPAGATAAMAISLDYGTATRQTSSPFTVKQLTQDGYAAGQLDNVTVSESGTVTASFSNGTSQALGKLVIANFTNPEGLRQLGDARWAATGQSGDPQVGTANSNGFGLVQSGALEQSNVDITNELVSLITAQRNFSANAKAIDTANQMTQTIVQLRS
jgi:flagellar hook protein FlgE